MKNELGMEIPIEVVKKAEKLGCMKSYDRLSNTYTYRYIYKKGLYGEKFPASSIGGHKATRFGNWKSINSNEVDLGMGWVAFKSPTYGGIDISKEKNTFTQNSGLELQQITVNSNELEKPRKNFFVRLKESAYENPWPVIAIVVTVILGIMKLLL